MRSTVKIFLATIGVSAAAALSLTGVAAAGTPGGEVGPLIGPPCAVGNLCVFDGPQYSGARHDMFKCGPPVDIRSKGLSRVGSFINNQTGDQVASFFGPNETGQIVRQYTSTAVDAQPDTTNQTTWVVQPC